LHELIYYIAKMSAPKTSEQKAVWKALRVESNNPYETTEWKFLWQIDEDELVKTQQLIDDLNIITAPLLLRIVPNRH
jgi:hypothetical protein